MSGSQIHENAENENEKVCQLWKSVNSVAERCDGVVKKGRCGKEIHTCMISLKGIISIIAWLQYSMGYNIISQHRLLMMQVKE
jgi:hypothetical protein